MEKKIKIIGVGDGGITIVEKLLKADKIPAKNLSLIRCDVSVNRLSISYSDEVEEKFDVMDSFYLENIFEHGLSTAGNMQEADEICHKNRRIIEYMLEDSREIIIAAALGGGISSAFVSYISNIAMMDKKIHLYLIYPLKFVSQNRQDTASRVLEKVKNSNVPYTLFYTDKIVEQNLDSFKENGFKMRDVFSIATDMVAKQILVDIEPYLHEKITMDEVHKNNLATYQKYTKAIENYYPMPTIPPSGELKRYKSKAQRIFESVILCREQMNQELNFKYNIAKKYEYEDSRYCVVYSKTVEEICQTGYLMENDLEQEISRATLGRYLLFFLKDKNSREVILAFLVRDGEIVWWISHGKRELKKEEEKWMKNYWDQIFPH